MKFSISAFCWIPLVAITSYCAYEQQIYGRRAQRDITLVLLISVVLRLTWFALQDVHYLGLRVLNRLSVMFQCMSVLMLLFIWMKSMTADEVLFWKCRNIAICGFAVLWVFVFVTTFLSKKIWYQVNVLTVGWVSLMIALVALCYGLVVNYKMRLIKDDAYLISLEYPQRKKIARRLILVSVVVSLCFGLRTVLFGLANEFLSDVYFPWFVYYVPEVIPLFAILLELSPEKGFIMRIAKCRILRGEEPRISENSEYPRPTSISIHMSSLYNINTEDDPTMCSSTMKEGLR